MKLVSIVVITYNSSSTLLETLNSIEAQSYPSIELIVSDDCSKDNTLDIAERWAQEHGARFADVQILRSSTNTGVTKNCNRGLSACNGEYVQLIAGDDLLLPNAVEEKYAFSEANGLNFFDCKVEPFGEDPIAVKEKKDWLERAYRIVNSGYKTQVEAILVDNFNPAPGGSFFRVEWLKRFGGFDERYPMMEDYPFVFHYIMGGNEIVLLDKVLMRYRVSSRSLSSGTIGEGNIKMLESEKSFFYRERLPELIKYRKWGIAIRRTCSFLYRTIKMKLLYH